MPGIQLEQPGFGSCRRICFRSDQIEPMGDAEDVGVDGNSLRVPEGLA